MKSVNYLKVHSAACPHNERNTGAVVDPQQVYSKIVYTWYVYPPHSSLSGSLFPSDHRDCQTAHHLPHRSPGLTKLNLAGLTGLTENGVAYISFLPALEQLCLARCKHVRRVRMEI